jgi:AraC-like DNA-binding protein
MEQRESTKEEYQKRVNIVFEYINNHLDRDIDLEKLASISNFSKWHFQQFTTPSMPNGYRKADKNCETILVLKSTSTIRRIQRLKS